MLHAHYGPLSLTLRPSGELLFLLLKPSERLLGESKGVGAFKLISRPSAAVLRGRVRVLINLENRRDGAFEKFAVVRDDHQSSRTPTNPLLQTGQTVEVEVVGRLVEQDDVKQREFDAAMATFASCPPDSAVIGVSIRWRRRDRPGPSPDERQRCWPRATSKR